MKYLKLFEQEDEWWEDESSFDEIKAGDEVKCVRDSDSEYYLRLNKIYIVKETFIDLEITYLKLIGIVGDWNSNRFEKIIRK